MSGDLIYKVTLAKQGLADALGAHSSLLHVPVGLICFGLFCAVSRGSPRRALWSALMVFAVQIVNESLDAVQWVRWTGSVNWGEAALDVVLTMAAPLVWVLVSDTGRARGRAGGAVRPVSKCVTYRAFGA